MDVEITMLPVEAWEAYRALRLRGLKEDPQAFGVSYEESLTFPPERWQMRLREAGTTGRSWLLFAKAGDQLVGMIGAYLDEDDPPDLATIVAVYVIAEQRGRGIGAMLLRGILDVLRQQPDLTRAKLCVNKKQHSAIKLYQRFGFAITGEITTRMGNGLLEDEYQMQREL